MAVQAEVRLYDRLFTDAQPDAGGKDYLALLNPEQPQSGDRLRRAPPWPAPKRTTSSSSSALATSSLTAKSTAPIGPYLIRLPDSKTAGASNHLALCQYQRLQTAAFGTS